MDFCILRWIKYGSFTNECSSGLLKGSSWNPCWPSVKQTLLNSDLELIRQLCGQECEWLTYSLIDNISSSFRWGIDKNQTSISKMIEMLANSVNNKNFSKELILHPIANNSILTITGKVDNKFSEAYKRLGLINYLYTYLMTTNKYNLTELCHLVNSSKGLCSFHNPTKRNIPRVVKEINVIYQSLISINSGNSSSFACSDLMALGQCESLMSVSK